MGTFFRGGWSKVEYSASSDMSNPTEIPNILKDKTKITFSTPVETLANENEAGAGKSCKMEIGSSDLTAGVYTALIAAEAALTQLYFRFTGLNVAQKYVIGPAVPRVEMSPDVAGKFHARLVTAVAYGVTEAGIVNLTLS
jgi:hypothetical protein